MRINIETNGVVMVSTHDQSSFCFHPLHNFMRHGTIVDQIAQTPKYVVLLFRQSLKSSQIRVYVRNDYNLHRFSQFTRCVCETCIEQPVRCLMRTEMT